MTGPHLLIIAIIVVLVIAFIITLLVLNNSSKKIISTNSKLVDSQNALLEQNKRLEEELKLQRIDEVSKLREQARQYRESIELSADMSDEELMTLLDRKMDETRLYTNKDLTLKTMANAFGLTQKRLSTLFKNNEKYANIGDYLNEKRILLACQLLREKPQYTIEAIGAEAGFGSRRTFQIEMKRKLGITPLQYRQGFESTPDAEPNHI
jgi:AraC-like DNA-binding protein